MKREEIISQIKEIINGEEFIKMAEIKVQDFIEKTYNVSLWWGICNVDIFSELLLGSDPLVVATKIVDDIEFFTNRES